jgi:hypothetical protein
MTVHAAPVLANVRRRLVPLLFLLDAYLDRINVGFAALRMYQALGFSATTDRICHGVRRVSDPGSDPGLSPT